MRLTDLMEGNLAPVLPAPTADPDIRGLAADSRQVEPGFLFAALPGSKADGKTFIDDAVGRGAVALLIDDPVALPDLHRRHPQIPVVVDSNARRRLALMAAEFYAPQPKTLVAVTGTNGKTSVVSFTRQIWQRLGQRAASLGTLGIVAPGLERPGSLTTPDPVTLHRTLRDLARRGVERVALEASSHGLDQFRLDGLDVAAAAFTNLTHDHLDYHRTMADYLRAKARLFDQVMAPGRVAVLNADVPESATLAEICRERGHRILSYGALATADLRLVSARPTAQGQELELRVQGARRAFFLPLVGRFQAMNALAAMGLALATGATPDEALAALTQLTGVPGRMQHVASHANGAPIFVDYAHTPDALENVLQALRPHARGKLSVVFGAGGDRDPAKRPVMGAIAAKLADRVIVTDDNPRSEEPAAIRRAILASAPEARDIGDRAEAIATAIQELQREDVLVIAGKGHERGQIINGVTHLFDDAEVARAAVVAIGRRRR
ncbi:MAG TPA: UDP-N-acetylmuramoyl-L-alanyl-D-glutamate--2,6-diaminopimelate ligase [Stellaceae bacterium]|nr:UDP-N-acetylmuramoyl-L-alanyl-D-glutamate--2,6-diaminopimelate ligase [Stellaceae bacterium]